MESTKDLQFETNTLQSYESGDVATNVAGLLEGSKAHVEYALANGNAFDAILAAGPEAFAIATGVGDAVFQGIVGKGFDPKVNAIDDLSNAGSSLATAGKSLNQPSVVAKETASAALNILKAPTSAVTTGLRTFAGTGSATV
jgi:hypothetical protein